MNQQVVTGQSFECRVGNGYIYDRVWGRISLKEAELDTNTLIKMAESTGYDRLLINIQGLEWINSLSLRLRGMELFFEGSKHYRHVALVSNRPAIIYLVTMLAKGGGIDSKSFDNETDAIHWLLARS